MLHSKNNCIIWGRTSIDGVSANFVPSRLLVSRNLIRLQAFSGTYYFPEDCVVCIEKISNSEIALKHVVRDYPTNIVFSGDNVFNQIQNSKYSATANFKEDKHVPHKGSAFKAWVQFFFYSLLSLIYLLPWKEGTRYMYGMSVMAICIATCIVLTLSRRAQLIALKPERRFREIRQKTIIFIVVLFSLFSWFSVSPQICRKYEALCKPQVFPWP